jgi:hypothetical protein
MILSAEYTLWSLAKRNNIKEECVRNNTEASNNVNGILFNEMDIKLSAECLFQELYVRAVDETFDPHNVIYFFYRICGVCNRYNCSDPDFQCVHVPAINRSDNYKCYKQAQRKILDILFKEYIDRHNLSVDTVERYRQNKRIIADLTRKTKDSSVNTVVTEPVVENHPNESGSLRTPEPYYETISDDEESINDFLKDISNNLPQELNDLSGLDINEFLQCNALYSDDSFVKSDIESSQLKDSKLSCVTYKTRDPLDPDFFPVMSEDEMMERDINLDQKGKKRWNWLETSYLKNAGYGGNGDEDEINEITEDTVCKFGLLLSLAEEDTKDILNVFCYFDHLCRECNICHTSNGRFRGDCHCAKNLQYRRDKPYREWREMNYLMHEFIKNSSIPLHVVENYRRRGPVRDSPLYKLRWTEKGEYVPKSGLWVDKKLRLPLQVHVLGGCMDINPELSIEQGRRLARMLNEFDEILAFNPNNIGTCSIIQHKIDTGDSAPIHQNPYIYAAPLREEISRQVNELIELGIVVPSKSPWSSPVVLVDKKDGTKRMCVDLRKVNSVTKSDVYPLPSISIALSSMQGAQYFSSIDLNCGYYQIELEESSREKTAFITQDGLYEYKKMMFGLKTAPSCFARTMDIVLAGLKWSSVLVYIDDILIFSKDFDSHVEHIREVFQRLKAANLTIKPN